MKYNIKGLTTEEAERSRQKYGANTLPPVKSETFFEKLMENFQDPLIHILMIALLITCVLAFLGYAEWFEGVGIAFAVFLATFVSTYSEYKNEASFQQLQADASRVKNNVFRNGNVENIFASEVVQGDSVLLQAGDKIPADGRLVQGELSVNQSTLNGEPWPTKKTVAPQNYNTHVDDSQVDFADHNLVFRGTVVEDGEAVLLVDAVGNKTHYGKLALELSTADTRESPLQVKLSNLADGISKLGYAGSILIAISFLFKQFVMDNNYQWDQIISYVTKWQLSFHDIVTSIILAIIVVVVAVPEGLPMMIAIVLSLNMRKLLKAKVLVRKLLGIETAGSLDILFVDKTGTLTKGTFVPRTFVSGDTEVFNGFAQIPEQLRSVLSFVIRESTNSVVAGNGELVAGNASDRALLEFLDKPSLNLQTGTETMSEILFNSQRKYAAAQLRVPRSDAVPQILISGASSGSSGSAKFLEITAVKGAPEIILPKCSHYYNSKGVYSEMTKSKLERLVSEINTLSSNGIRVIAVATSREKLHQDNELPRELSLVGTIGVYDEIREESRKSIEVARAAGIQVVMITGDKKETAVNVAEQINLIKKGDSEKHGVVLTSQDLQRLSDEELRRYIPNLRVIARALPTDKSRFVNVAKSLNKVVGMTGDGVNDSAALKAADVGFAMGSGSEVSKEAADIVILNDNFASITEAVLYGRTIYKSIQKFIIFQSTINVSSLLIAFLGPFMGFDFPLTLIQLLWVNLVMDSLAALAFGGEPPLSRYMKEAPIKRDQAIITPYMWASILSGGAFVASMSIFWLTYDDIAAFFVRNGVPSDDAFLTAFFAFFIFLSVFNAFNVRTAKINIMDHITGNRGFILVIFLIFVVQISFSYIGGRILRTVGLTQREWIVVILGSMIIFPFDILRKLFLYPIVNTSWKKKDKEKTD
eukprot:TRINITY_DN8456_c0_g1_i1.p1 TRINITY_DN8456_c0_g1~~TRINITY_DN8456_c0_g1_i1.p1  ORF type:complete len:930 (-),score=214.88 TRINITY_DN8456_c0_g1_i1:15-2804(-)